MKKVLVITYHWPPSGGIGVLRCLKLVKYLRDFGWEPVVFTAKNASYQFIDRGNEKDIPDNLEIHQVPIFEPINAFKRLTGRKIQQPLQNITNNSGKKKGVLDKFSLWLRGNFFIPDARAAWIKPSVAYLRNYLKDHPVDAIFTDGPPHTNTVIGMRLAEEFGIPWLADFQDPWTQVDYYQQLYIGKRADKKHRKLEQEVFQKASKITIASPSWKTDLEAIGAKNVSVFYYGYDESDFNDYRSSESANDFVIFHGGLLGDDRNPSTLLKVIADLSKVNEHFNHRVKIVFAGEVDFNIQQEIIALELEDKVSYLGMIPRKSVIKTYESCSLLLLPINKAANAKGRIPGKLFELLRTGKEILVLGPSDADVKKIVTDAKAGMQFEYDDYNGLKEYLTQLFANGRNEQTDLYHVEQYSNYRLTEQISKLLHEIKP